ncbi:hypothetical protein DFJ73DRAFT_803576 [Zopfochytrium polystomum]|nr:hypothetical protein DFJ73DRAFT_803576 [Zopfochytrium polystomum]
MRAAASSQRPLDDRSRSATGKLTATASAAAAVPWQCTFTFSERAHASSVGARANDCVAWLLSPETPKYAQLEIRLDARGQPPRSQGIGDKHAAVRLFLVAVSHHPGLWAVGSGGRVEGPICLHIKTISNPSNRYATGNPIPTTVLAAINETLLLPPTPRLRIGTVACDFATITDDSIVALGALLRSPSCRLRALTLDSTHSFGYCPEQRFSFDLLRRCFAHAPVLASLRIDARPYRSEFAVALGAGLREGRSIQALNLLIYADHFQEFVDALTAGAAAECGSSQLQELTVSFDFWLSGWDARPETKDFVAAAVGRLLAASPRLLRSCLRTVRHTMYGDFGERPPFDYFSDPHMAHILEVLDARRDAPLQSLDLDWNLSDACILRLADLLCDGGGSALREISLWATQLSKKGLCAMLNASAASRLDVLRVGIRIEDTSVLPVAVSATDPLAAALQRSTLSVLGKSDNFEPRQYVWERDDVCAAVVANPYLHRLVLPASMAALFGDGDDSNHDKDHKDDRGRIDQGGRRLAVLRSRVRLTTVRWLLAGAGRALVCATVAGPSCGDGRMPLPLDVRRFVLLRLLDASFFCALDARDVATALEDRRSIGWLLPPAGLLSLAGGERQFVWRCSAFVAFVRLGLLPVGCSGDTAAG